MTQKQMLGIITDGQEVTPVLVTDDGTHYRDHAGNTWAKIGTAKVWDPKTLTAMKLAKRASVVLLSNERAASYEPPRGKRTVKVGDPSTEDPTDFIEVEVTQKTFNTLGVELAAKALQAAQKPPFWLLAMILTAGIGVGWIIRMFFDLGMAKLAGG